MSKRFQPLPLMPERLSALRVHCGACAAVFKPSFFRTMKEPFVPVRPNDGEGQWIPACTREACPRCGGFGDLELPFRTMRARCTLFGDEAFREHEGQAIATYSLVGADDKILDERLEHLSRAKRALEPDRDPSSWSFHMKELWSSQSRRKHPVFGAWSDEKVRESYDFVSSVFTADKLLHVYNIVVRGPSKTIELTKRRAYSSLFLLVVDDLTDLGAQPRLYFDAERPSSGSRIVQGWARELVDTTQRWLLYPLIAHGIEVPEPEFVEPGSHPGLELADFVSFVVARYYFDRWRGKVPFLGPERLGQVRYVGFEPSGDMVFSTQVGYPWERFHSSSWRAT